MIYKEIKFSEVFDFDTMSKTLKCPRCDGEYTHQGTVEVFNRGEDAVTGTHTIVEWNTVKFDNNLAENPSYRRQGIAIHFDCEQCGKEAFAIEIAQHKGNTLVSTRYKELAPTP